MRVALNVYSVKKTVIPAAGLGTRMRPLSIAVPKELLPVGNQPMMHYAVHEAVAAGVEDIFVVTNKRRKAAIERYYEESGWGNRVRGGTEIHFIEQPHPHGIVDAVMQAQPFLEQQPFFLLLPDNVFWGESPSTRQMLTRFQEYGETVLGLIEVNHDTAPLFGNCGAVTLEAIKENVFVVNELKDKMPGHFELGDAATAIRACGRFILRPDFFDEAAKFDSERLRQNGEVPIIQSLIAKRKVNGVLLKGRLFDCGNPDGYWKANEYWMKAEQKWS